MHGLDMALGQDMARVRSPTASLYLDGVVKIVQQLYVPLPRLRGASWVFLLGTLKTSGKPSLPEP